MKFSATDRVVVTRITRGVSSCRECPERQHTMEGEMCGAIKKPLWVYPEGRTKVHHSCPFNHRKY